VIFLQSFDFLFLNRNITWMYYCGYLEHWPFLCGSEQIQWVIFQTAKNINGNIGIYINEKIERKITTLDVKGDILFVDSESRQQL
jgi:hypothetical protein